MSSAPEADADPQYAALPGQNPIGDLSLSAALLGAGNPLQSQSFGNPLTAARRSPLLDVRNPVHLQRKRRWHINICT